MNSNDDGRSWIGYLHQRRTWFGLEIETSKLTLKGIAKRSAKEVSDDRQNIEHIHQEFSKAKADLYTWLLLYEGYIKPHTREEIFSVFGIMDSLYDLNYPTANTFKLDGSINDIMIKPNWQIQW